MNKKNIIQIITCLVLIITFYACDRRVLTRTDTETSGNALLASDDCFAPIVKEELDVFTGLNPEAVVTPIYTSEPEAFNLLLKDSIRLIIATRNLTANELASIKERKLTPRTQLLASDGLALIINIANVDSIININKLKKIMSGEITKWNELNLKTSKLGDIKVVFNHPNSSTLRYITDSINQGKPLYKQISALESNSEVLEYVKKTPNALGIIGVNWISNPNDSTKLSFDKSIRVMAVGKDDEINVENTYKPFPVFLNNKCYPLTRNVYIILTDCRETLPSGIVKFFAGDAGQRIILKAGLVPGTRPTREIYIKDSF